MRIWHFQIIFAIYLVSIDRSLTILFLFMHSFSPSSFTTFSYNSFQQLPFPRFVSVNVCVKCEFYSQIKA